ncbi:MAG TPA: (Fe-S)-binding protein [Xanthobacteraceae bacterium]|nr:(Fe-S)-binding protein [Xanthobacteraceae bacterium]
MPETFESALQARVDGMIDACTRCGKCVEACPVTAAAGLEAAARNAPVEVIGGVIDILRGAEGNAAARAWAAGCVRSGDCIEACDYGVNPRFLLSMARAAMARAANDPAALRKKGVEGFRHVARDVAAMSKIQLDDALLARLGQGARQAGESGAKADFIFYTGCNVLKTPHIALYALDIMDALDISYEVMGGPTHCCGVQQLRSGDLATFGRVAESALDKLSQSKTGQVISWCPSCHVQFTEMTLPAAEKTRGAKPFDMTPFTMFVHKHLDRLRPLLRNPVPMRIALHKHPGVRGVVAAAEDILRSVPGVEIVDLHQPAVGLQANDLKPLPGGHRRDLQVKELEAAEAAGIDALVALYHSDHRELCAHERDFPFQILNLYEVVGLSMGLYYEDSFKRLKLMQDADAILADCEDLVERHGLDRDTTRAAIQTMLAEQPAPLRGGMSQ